MPVVSDVLQPAERGRTGLNKEPKVLDVGNSFCRVRKGVILLTITSGRTVRDQPVKYQAIKAEEQMKMPKLVNRTGSDCLALSSF